MAAMKMKSFLCIAVAGSIALSSSLFGQTSQMTGRSWPLPESLITIQKDGEEWAIRRVPSTKVNGDLQVGSTVTITYNEPDAQKKETPMGGTPTPAGKNRSLPSGARSLNWLHGKRIAGASGIALAKGGRIVGFR